MMDDQADSPALRPLLVGTVGRVLLENSHHRAPVGFAPPKVQGDLRDGAVPRSACRQGTSRTVATASDLDAGASMCDGVSGQKPEEFCFRELMR
jgi:hypothetical protein